MDLENYLSSQQKHKKYNFDKDKVINPLTNDKILTWYMSNETYPSKFKKMHSAYEECRADTTAMYLSHFKEPYEIMFAGKEDEWDDIHYTMWHEVIRRGLFGLSFYDEESQTWGQAHVQGNYVIMRVIFETESWINIDFTEKDGKEYFYFSLNRDKIKTDGHEAIKKFLLKLHIYKCLADSESAYELFGGYSQVNDYFLKIREIVLKNKMARRLELQGNLFLNTNKKVEYKTYEETHEGIVRSYIERSSHISYNSFLVPS